MKTERISNNVRAERARKGWSVNRLAKESGVTAYAIRAHESGGVSLRMDNLLKIAKALECSASALIEEAPLTKVA